MDTTVMKKYLYSSIMLAMLIGSQVFADTLQTKSGAISNNIQMSVSLKSGVNEIKTNQPVVLLIRFKNISTNETFRIYQANAIEYDRGYTWVVISPSGNDISPNMEKIPVSESGGFIRLSPNQIKELEFNLSHLCKFDEIGTYKIVAKKTMLSPENQKPVTVVSNPLNIVISN
jgi:hypothetical protein